MFYTKQMKIKTATVSEYKIKLILDVTVIYL